MSYQSLAPKKERQSNLELLRIIAMLCIVLHHSCVHSGFTQPIAMFSISGVLLNMTVYLGDLGNSLFLLISGYFMVNTSFSLRRVLRVWAQMLFYSVGLTFVLWLCGALEGQALTFRDVLRMFFPVSTQRYWFASTYVIFCLLAPFLNKLLHSIGENGRKRFLLVLLVLFSLLPTFVQAYMPLGSLAKFVFLYSVGAYLRLNPAPRLLSSRRRCFAVGGGTLLLLIAFIAVCLALGQRFWRFNYYATFFMGEFAPPILLASVGLFMGFKDLNIRPSRVVNAVASTAFGVYLIHDHELVRQWLWKGVVHTQDYANTPWISPYMLLCTVAVFIACMLIDLARQRFIEPLYMRLIDRVPPVRRELEKAQERCKAKT